MRTQTIIDRLEDNDAKAVAHAQAKIDNPNVCEHNRNRLAEALDEYNERNAGSVAPTPAPVVVPESKPALDPIEAAKVEVAQLQRSLAWSAREASVEGDEAWNGFIASIVKANPEVATDLVAMKASNPGKVTYKKALAAIGGTPARSDA